MLSSPEVVEFRNRLILALKNNSPKEGFKGALPFAFWLTENISKQDFVLLNSIEEKLGFDVANKWLCDVMVATGLYRVVDESEVVSPTGGNNEGHQTRSGQDGT